jgi:hypothetical protein
MSVPDPDELPKTPLPENIRKFTYPADGKPVFFGHYWLTGTPAKQAPNALCLDYSAGKDGPLVSYVVDGENSRIELDDLNGFATK